MQIHKFGGASISTAERIRNVGRIISSFKNKRNLVVISALGKMTNALEEAVSLYLSGNASGALDAVQNIQALHLHLAEDLLQNRRQDCSERLKALVAEASRKLQNANTESFHFFYDQVVPYGELLSTTLLHYYLLEIEIDNIWVDARKILLTNDSHREASILWDETSGRVAADVLPGFEQASIVLTQGFIGSTLQGDMTTLGREGSDFTAAVLANITDAQTVTIWKDVPGVMNADPRLFAEAVMIPHLGYSEVIEMSYYGAQVIHPKTIKPLQNKLIPLFVRSFLNPDAPGTVIDDKHENSLPPVIVLKQKQILLSFQTKDFSFIEGRPTSMLNDIVAEAGIKANLSQNTAISLLLSLDDIPEKIGFILARSDEFIVEQQEGLTLLTIRHYDDEIIRRLLSGRKVILEQRTAKTLQVLY